MDQEQLNLLNNIILVTYTQTKDQEERMVMPLVLEVPVSWIDLIKQLSPKGSFGEVVELALLQFFNLGVITFLEKMQEQYTSPQEIVKKYQESLSK